MINTGLFTRTKYNNEMNGVNYDNWLNSTNPYNNELDDELLNHLIEMRDMDDEEDRQNYCDKHHLKYSDIEQYL